MNLPDEYLKDPPTSNRANQIFLKVPLKMQEKIEAQIEARNIQYEKQKKRIAEKKEKYDKELKSISEDIINNLENIIASSRIICPKSKWISVYEIGQYMSPSSITKITKTELDIIMKYLNDVGFITEIDYYYDYRFRVKWENGIKIRDPDVQDDPVVVIPNKKLPIKNQSNCIIF
jgi:hypothetical protein